MLCYRVSLFIIPTFTFTLEVNAWNQFGSVLKGATLRVTQEGEPRPSPACDMQASADAPSWGPRQGQGATYLPVLCRDSGTALGLASRVTRSSTRCPHSCFTYQPLPRSW